MGHPASSWSPWHRRPWTEATSPLAPRLGEEGSDEPEGIRRWFAHAGRGVSPLNKRYWDAPWSVEAGLALVRPAEYPPEWTPEAYWRGEGRAEDSAAGPGEGS
jgi:hypothetical protein